MESDIDMADLKVDSTSADSFISSVGLNLTYDGAISSTPVLLVGVELSYSDDTN